MISIAKRTIHFFIMHQTVTNDPINNTFPKSPGGQYLCRKSTSGWTVANVFYGAGRSPMRQKYVQLLSRAARGRCNRYCPTIHRLHKLQTANKMPNNNLFFTYADAQSNKLYSTYITISVQKLFSTEQTCGKLSYKE